jgi:hypothetical protein
MTWVNGYSMKCLVKGGAKFVCECNRACTHGVYLWSSTSCLLGLIYAWVASMNLVRVVPPTLVPKMTGSDRSGSMGWSSASWASLSSGHCVIMCSAVCKVEEEDIHNPPTSHGVTFP